LKRAVKKLFCFLLALSKNKCAFLGIAKNGFVKTEKRGGKQVIKNRFHFYINVPMKPCLYIIAI